MAIGEYLSNRARRPLQHRFTGRAHFIQPSDGLVHRGLLQTFDIFFAQRGDFEEGVAEGIERAFTFGFGGFDHQAIVDGPMDGGGMEATVDEVFGDVHDRDAAVEDGLGDGDELMRARIGGHRLAFLRAVGQRVGVLDALGDVIGGEDGGLADVSQALGTARADVGVRPNQHIELAGKTADFADGFGAVVIPGISPGERTED